MPNKSPKEIISEIKSLIKNGYKNPNELKRIFQEAGHTHLKSSERLLCIGTL